MELNIPRLLNDSFKFCTYFVIHDLKLCDMPFLLESGHDDVLSFDTMFVATSRKGLKENRVGVAVIGYHYILVATASTDGKSCEYALSRCVVHEICKVVTSG